MPAESEAQRRYLFAKFGAAWVKRHGFDNKGPLPMHVKSKPNRQRLAESLAQKKNRMSDGF